MDALEAIKARHAVRSYTDKKIEGETLDELTSFIQSCNRESDLHIQLCLNEPQAFSGMMARYGKFENVRNYIALVGKKSDSLEESCGYYGEKIVIKAQQLGLNTCWVAMTFSKGKSKNVIKINPGEKLLIVIPVGYGNTQGATRKTRTLEEVSTITDDSPQWFRDGVAAALLAPTANNQQKFRFELKDDKVLATPGSGFYSKVDLGIAKYHFELGSGHYKFK